MKQHLKTAWALTAIIVVLAAIAAAGGLFIPGLYRDNAWVVRVNRGQDLYTLIVAVPATLVTLAVVRRGSSRGPLVLVGLVGYLLYTYTGAAFAFALNDFYLIYLALYSISIAALISLLTGIDIAGLPGRFDSGTPRRPVAIFLAVISLMLAFVEIGQIIPFYTSGVLPEPVRLAGVATFFPYTLDLGIVMPLSLLSAVWLWQRRPWGYMLGGCMLIKSATMGLALLATNAYGFLTGGATDSAGILLGYFLIGLGGLGMSVWFFRHCRGQQRELPQGRIKQAAQSQG